VAGNRRRPIECWATGSKNPSRQVRRPGNSGQRCVHAAQRVRSRQCRSPRTPRDNGMRYVNLFNAGQTSSVQINSSQQTKTVQRRGGMKEPGYERPQHRESAVSPVAATSTGCISGSVVGTRRRRTRQPGCARGCASCAGQQVWWQARGSLAKHRVAAASSPALGCFWRGGMRRMGAAAPPGSRTVAIPRNRGLPRPRPVVATVATAVHTAS